MCFDVLELGGASFSICILHAFISHEKTFLTFSVFSPNFLFVLTNEYVEMSLSDQEWNLNFKIADRFEKYDET